MAFTLDKNLLSQLEVAWNGGDKPLDTLAGLLERIGDGVRDREFPLYFGGRIRSLKNLDRKGNLAR